jgi:rubredoxin
MKKWRCRCGYIHDGDAPPADGCPRCSATAEGFTLLDDEAAERVEDSRHANALHCRLVDLGRQMERLCKEGIERELDPGCTEVFKKTLQHSYEIMKLSMAEMQAHIGRGMWG